MTESPRSGWLTAESGVRVPRDELEYRFIRSSGPGGQHANRSATAVQLRFDVRANRSLPAAVRTRLARLAGGRMTKDGTLLLQSDAHRSQRRNRDEVDARLVELLRRAAQPPKPRRPTRPSRTAKARRLRNKRARAEKKRRRRYDPRRDG